MKRSTLLLLALVTTSSLGVFPAGASPVPMPPELWVMNAEGSDQRRLTEGGPEGDRVSGHSWSPGGTEIAFVSSGSTVRIYSMAEGTDRIVAEIDSVQSVNWSPDGQWLALVVASGTPRGLFLIRPDGSGLHHAGPDAQAIEPDWSPDSSKVAAVFVTDPFTDPYVAVVNLDGTYEVLTRDTSFGGPDWSPDGTRIAYVDVEGRLSVIDSAESISRLTSSGEAAHQPDWKPDGSKIAYSSSTGIAAIEPDGSGRLILLEGGSIPEWHPDGGSLLARRDGDIYRVNSDGTGVTNLTNSDQRIDHAALWSPDGSKIAYLSSEWSAPPEETIERTISLRQRRHLILKGSVRDVGHHASTCLATPTTILIQRRQAGAWNTMRRISADEDGSFRSRVADRPGRYRALVRRKTFSQPGPGHQVTCTRARSRTVTHSH